MSKFKAAFLRAAPPTTLEGIERYLGSGLIKGIGPIYAGKLVRAFGESVFDVIEQEPRRLREVTGVGPKRAERIVAGSADHEVIREIMLFLHSYREVHTHARGHSDHARSSTAMMHPSAAASTWRSTRIRRPLPSTISIRPIPPRERG